MLISLYPPQLAPTFVFLLHQVTDDLVIKVINLFPLNPFTLVLVLLTPQRQLNEYLLQLLIAVINAELFKPDNK